MPTQSSSVNPSTRKSIAEHTNTHTNKLACYQKIPTKCLHLQTAIFGNMTINTFPACMLFLLQKPLLDQRHQNLAVPQSGSHHGLCFPIPCLPLPLSPQKENPHRTPWREKKQLPSVGSRWTPSPFSFTHALFFFSPSSCSPGFLTFISVIPISFATTLSLPNLCVCVYAPYCTVHSHAFYLFPLTTLAAELLSDTGSM